MCLTGLAGVRSVASSGECPPSLGDFVTHVRPARGWVTPRLHEDAWDSPPPLLVSVGHRIQAGRLAELRQRGRDHVIAAIAEEQYGVVSYAQLLEAGV